MYFRLIGPYMDPTSEKESSLNKLEREVPQKSQSKPNIYKSGCIKAIAFGIVVTIRIPKDFHENVNIS